MSAIRRFFQFWGHALSYDNVGNLGELQRRWETEQGAACEDSSVPAKTTAAKAAATARLPSAATVLHGSGSLN